MKFEKTGRPDGTPAAWLKVREGCYLRIRDITGITVGVPDEDGKILHDTVVFVHLANGSGAGFDPCESAEEARAMAGQLVGALEDEEKTAAAWAEYRGVLRHGF